MLKRIQAHWRKLRNHRAGSLLFDVVLILAVFWAVHAWNTRDLPGSGPAPQLSLAMLDGDPRASLPGQGTGVVYFFAPWCSICRHSIGNLDRLVERGDVDWARAVALDYADPDELRAFIEETRLTQPVLLGDRGTGANWHVRAFPTYFVIDGKGRIASRSVGYSTLAGMRLRAWLAD